MQLELFQGEHIPLIRARAALERGDLRGAHEALSSACVGSGGMGAAERLRVLERLCAEHREWVPDDVHAAFLTALAKGEPAPRDPISGGEWFRFYAAHVARALEPVPLRRFRGWCGFHFELAAGRPQAAFAAVGRLVSHGSPAWAWLEAARVAHAVGETAQARRWIVTACLSAREPLPPHAPLLVPTGCRELDAPGFTLPALPRELAELWEDALEMELAGLACAWVPSIGLIEGILPPADLRSLVARSGGLDREFSGAHAPPPLAFLRALIAARDARSRESPSGAGCGPAELRARAEMQRSAPALFERYMQRLGLGL
jgi:hypothetical protein